MAGHSCVPEQTVSPARVSWLAEGWVFLNRLRRRVGKPSAEEWWARRESFIDEHAGGRSFADIGGLFMLHGEMAYRAERAGATQVTLFDSGDPDYGGFDQRRRETGSRIRFVQGDLEEEATPERVGLHDVVWCTGVVYHTPNPVLQLMRLREITRELLYLGTHSIPEIPGFEQACVFYPYLPDRERRAHARAHWNAADLHAVGTPFDDLSMHGYGNFWWGITPSALRAMLRTARFEVIDEIRPRDYPWLLDVVARPIDEAPVMPPPAYFRERAERRERGEPPLPWLEPARPEPG
jgi:hypothetical protein